MIGNQQSFNRDRRVADSEQVDERHHLTRDWEAERRASETVSDGIRAWEEGDLETAERQLRAGLAAYREIGEDEVDYALGRLGDFLAKQDRLDEAAEFLEEALQKGTTITAIWGNYRMSIWRWKERGEWNAERSERAEAALRAGFGAAERRGPPHQAVAFDALAGFLLGEDRPDDAEREVRTALEIVPNDISLLRSLRQAMYLKRDAAGVVEAAIREFGVRKHVIHEFYVYDQLIRWWSELCGLADQTAREGKLGFAEELARCIVEGTQSDGNVEVQWMAVGTLGRVIERADRVSEAIEMWQSAFERGSRDPLTVNRLSMHLERQRKLAEAIAVIEQAFEQSLPSDSEDQLRKRLERCRARLEKRSRREVPAFSVRTGGHELHLLSQARVSPAVQRFHAARAIGRSWSVRRSTGSWAKWEIDTGTVLDRRDDLPRLRNFEFAADGHAIGATQTGPVDECVTDLSFLSPDGDLVGTNQMPNGFTKISGHSGDFWVIGCRDGGLYAYSVRGEHLWTWNVPGSEDYHGDRYLRPCPFVVAANNQGALIASFGSVYRITHGGDLQWTFEVASQVQRVQRVYEKTMTVGQDDLIDIEIEISFDLFPRMVKTLLASGSLSHIAAIDGKLYSLDDRGVVIDARALGERDVYAYADAEQGLVAAWCDNQLFRFDGFAPLPLTEHRGIPDGVGTFGEDLYVWRDKQVSILDQLGREIWSAEFPKRINSVVVDEDRLIVAGGVVAAFRRNSA